MQNAIEKRDSAIIAAVHAFDSSVSSALNTRKEALKNAWKISDSKERNKAIEAAWKNFNGTWKKANKALRDARNAAWSQYNKDVKACKGQVQNNNKKDKFKKAFKALDLRFDFKNDWKFEKSDKED